VNKDRGLRNVPLQEFEGHLLVLGPLPSPLPVFPPNRRIKRTAMMNLVMRGSMVHINSQGSLEAEVEGIGIVPAPTTTEGKTDARERSDTWLGCTAKEEDEDKPH